MVACSDVEDPNIELKSYTVQEVILIFIVSVKLSELYLISVKINKKCNRYIYYRIYIFRKYDILKRKCSVKALLPVRAGDDKDGAGVRGRGQPGGSLRPLPQVYHPLPREDPHSQVRTESKTVFRYLPKRMERLEPRLKLRPYIKFFRI